MTVAFAALCAGIVVWWLLVRRLTVKPWERTLATDALVSGPVNNVPSTPTAKVGLWVFLTVITALFGLFISAYFIRMGYGHGHGAKQAIQMNDWRAVAEPPILWLNTVLLIVSSILMQAARHAAAAQQPERARHHLIAGGVLTILFLAGQLTAWQQLSNSGYVLGSNPAAAFFYLLTAIHGLHLLGGLFVWAKTLVRWWTRDAELIDMNLSVELSSVYWHYLLLVWLVLFALLLYT